MEFKKQHLTDFRIRKVWTLFGLFISDNCLIFNSLLFSFLPKKVEIKETAYRIRYIDLNSSSFWSDWEHKYKYKK